MATINPFYRFEDAIQNSSMSQGAKAISYATFELYNSLITSFTGQGISVSLNTINAYVDFLNNLYSSINAKFVLDIVQFPSPISAPYNYQCYIYDTNIVKTYPLLRISLTFELNASQVIVNYKTSFIGYLNEYYSFSAPLLDGEKDAYQSLLNYQATGAAVFPRWYTFDATTGVATSLLARFKDCKIDSQTGFPVRDTPDSNARGNRPSIKLNPLDSDGKYIISLFTQLIELAGVVGTSFNDLNDAWQTWSLPTNYLSTSIIDTGAINRLQIDIYKDDNTFGFCLIVREDIGFSFQRFYTESYATYDFINDFSQSTPLPYETPNYYLRYNDIFYDYDFCDFGECQYPPKESYLMPIKPGDNYQFNVIPELANTMTDASVDVGIFDKDFNLIQKVGTTTIPTIECECIPCQLVMTYQIDESEWPQYLIDVSQLNTLEATNLNFRILKNNETFAFAGLSFVNPPDPYTFENILDAGLSIDPPVYLTFENGTYTFTCTIPNAVCGDIYRFTNEISDATIFPTTWIEVFSSADFECQLPTLTGDQSHAKVTIPSLRSDCYRFGLYRFESAIEGLKSTFENQSLTPGANYCLGLVDSLGIAQYIVGLPNSLSDFDELGEYLQSYIPFGSIVYDNNIPEIRITLYPYVPLVGWTIQIGTYDYGTGGFTGLSFTPDTAPPIGNTNINELYAFSNLLYLDNSDCFSQMLQYWVNNNSIGEGFEYYGGWFQQVRLGINGGGKKPVITDSVYRQSNGVHRRPSNKQDLSIDLHTDFLDFETQSALVDATRHTNFVLEGQSLFVNGDIEVATIQDFSTQSSFEDLAQVKFSALIQGYQPKNSTCINC